MSSIVSRRPPLAGSVSQAKDRRWMSMRLGTSRVLLRRAKLRRVRRASAEAKEATPSQGVKRTGDRAEARPLKIAQAIGALNRAASTHGPRPGDAYVARRRHCGRLRLLASSRHFTGKSARL